ncbi:hypothetical protein COLO4_20830 [Corchorus olitorius]|uniref:Uncharacterized protein n=1 Tax=Corchorus olitorius TaxID=93759 RepID=A0A1R3IWM8_9ROSI|nr:hypothetical protein COLO4_20830 [Corchorus olitorius]
MAEKKKKRIERYFSVCGADREDEFSPGHPTISSSARGSSILASWYPFLSPSRNPWMAFLQLPVFNWSLIFSAKCLCIDIIVPNLVTPVKPTYHNLVLHPYILSHGNKCTERTGLVLPKDAGSCHGTGQGMNVTQHKLNGKRRSGKDQQDLMPNFVNTRVLVYST